jgi:hypothetical protein
VSRAQEVREQLAELNPGALFADGFDDALVGIARQFNRHLALYDYKKCVEIIAGQLDGDEVGLDLDERAEMAVEYMEFNVVGAWMGENTPVFMMTE